MHFRERISCKKEKCRTINVFITFSSMFTIKRSILQKKIYQNLDDLRSPPVTSLTREVDPIKAFLKIYYNMCHRLGEI